MRPTYTLSIAASALAVLFGTAVFAHANAQQKPTAPAVAEVKKDEIPDDKRHKGMPYYLQSYDKNADGTLSKEEYDTGLSAEFKAADKSGKGQLSRTDVEALVRTQMEDRVKKMADGIYRSVDSNTDGIISKQEWEDAQKARFAKMDKNSDGKVEAQEFKRGHHGMKGHYEDKKGSEKKS